MEPSRRVQIHQYNDPEILEFFNKHRVRYRLVGDHLFIIRSRGHDVAAGPGDWLSRTTDGEIDVEPGDYVRRAQQAIKEARRARPRLPGRSTTRSRLAKNRGQRIADGPIEETPAEVPESDTERWKRRVEAEARDRLKRNIRHVAHTQ